MTTPPRSTNPRRNRSRPRGGRRHPGPEAEDAAAETTDGILAVLEGLFAGGMPPGLAFFLGGAVVLTLVVGLTYLRARP